MTFGIISESDSKGRAVCQFWLQGGKHNVTPTDKLPTGESHLGDLLTPPPPNSGAEPNRVDALSSLPALLS